MKLTAALFAIVLLLTTATLFVIFAQSENRLIVPVQKASEDLLGVTSKNENEDEEKYVDVKEPTTSASLTIPIYMSQTFNNCGPANLAMLFNFWGTPITQQKIAEDLRPFNNPKGGVDDKSVYNSEMAAYAKLNGFESVVRPNGDTEKIKKLLANGVPVVVSAWLKENEDIGHYRLVKGFDESTKTFSTDDSYLGPNQSYSYDQFMKLWKPFNYVYFITFPEEKSEIVNAILGEEVDQNIAYRRSIERAERDLKTNPYDTDAEFNIATANYHLGNFQKTVEIFEKVESKLPNRMLWYQLEPIYAYKQTENDDKALYHADKLLNNGNLAFSEMYQLKGEIFLQQGKKDEAKEMFEKAFFYNKQYSPAKESLSNLN